MTLNMICNDASKSDRYNLMIVLEFCITLVYAHFNQSPLVAALSPILVSLARLSVVVLPILVL